MVHPEISNESDLIHAFYCFVSDSEAGGEKSFEEFCSDFGYDEDSRKAENIYKACGVSAKKFNRVFTCDIYDLLNELSENYNC